MRIIQFQFYLQQNLIDKVAKQARAAIIACFVNRFVIRTARALKRDLIIMILSRIELTYNNHFYALCGSAKRQGRAIDFRIVTHCDMRFSFVQQWLVYQEDRINLCETTCIKSTWLPLDRILLYTIFLIHQIRSQNGVLSRWKSKIWFVQVSSKFIHDYVHLF